MPISMPTEHPDFMELALVEARKGLGRTSPNPAVGAVIVNNGRIVGRGFHRKAGTPHAEINAIADAGYLTRGATLYVTLEPCNHTGRTPPCTEAILRSSIAKVFIGMMDPNPRVTGGGADYLRLKGVEVHTGVLEEQCLALNHPFIKHSTTGYPWVIMKAGVSLDGRITYQPRRGEAITGEEANQYVHQLRDQSDAILIGVETAIIDDPRLTTRLAGVNEMRDPLRIVLDSTLRLPATARMLTQDSAAETWVICGEGASQEQEAKLRDRGAIIQHLPVDAAGRINLPSLFTFLGRQGILSVLVEGGAQVHGALYRERLVDEVVLLYAPVVIGDKGTPLVSGYSLNDRKAAPILRPIALQPLGQDFLMRALVDWKSAHLGSLI